MISRVIRRIRTAGTLRFPCIWGWATGGGVDEDITTADFESPRPAVSGRGRLADAHAVWTKPFCDRLTYD